MLGWQLTLGRFLAGARCRFADEDGLPRYALTLTPFEIGMILDWAAEWPVNMEVESVLRKLHGAVDPPLHEWSDGWDRNLDKETALARLRSALNPVVVEFTIQEMKSMQHWNSPERFNNYGTGGNFQLSEEKILLEKLKRAIDQAGDQPAS